MFLSHPEKLQPAGALLVVGCGILAEVFQSHSFNVLVVSKFWLLSWSMTACMLAGFTIDSPQKVSNRTFRRACLQIFLNREFSESLPQGDCAFVTCQNLNIELRHIGHSIRRKNSLAWGISGRHVTFF
jgi:hypothetical protein